MLKSPLILFAAFVGLTVAGCSPKVAGGYAMEITAPKLKMSKSLDLELRDDGSYAIPKLEAGRWKVDGDRLTMSPDSIGGMSRTQFENRLKSNASPRVKEVRQKTLDQMYSPKVFVRKGDGFEATMDGSTIRLKPKA